MKDIFEYLNPLEVSGKVDCTVCVMSTHSDTMKIRNKLRHPTVFIGNSKKFADEMSAYVDYLKYIVDNYQKLPRTIVFARQSVFEDFALLGMSEKFLSEINQVETIYDTLVIGPKGRVESSERFNKWCKEFGIITNHLRYSKYSIYAVNRLSVLRNSLNYYEKLLRWALENRNDLQFISFAWLSILNEGTLIPSVYEETPKYVELSKTQQKKKTIREIGKLPKKIEAVTVCVNFAKIFKWTLFNKKHFDRWVIVTADYDKETQNLCAKNGIECVVSDRIHEGGVYVYTHSGLKTPTGFRPGEKVQLDRAPLAKGKAINDGLAKCDGDGWLIHLDADILLSDDFGSKIRNTRLNEKNLYGMSRRLNKSGDYLGGWKDGLGKGVDGAIGWFQMFHSSAFESSLDGKYSEESADTWWDDIKFAEAFEDNQSCLSGLDVISVNEETSTVNQIENWYLNVKKTKVD